MQLNFFNGGLSTKLAEHLLQVNEAVVCENVDFSKGVLTPLKADIETTRDGGNSIYEFKNNWIISEEHRDYVEFQNRLYYSNGDTKPQKTNNGVEFFNLGIEKPEKVGTLFDSTPQVNTGGVVEYELETLKIQIINAVNNPHPNVLFGLGTYNIYIVYDKGVIKYIQHKATTLWLILSDKERNGHSYSEKCEIFIHKVGENEKYIWRYNWNNVEYTGEVWKGILPSWKTQEHLLYNYPGYKRRILENRYLVFHIQQDSKLYELSLNTFNSKTIPSGQPVVNTYYTVVSKIKFTMDSETENHIDFWVAEKDAEGEIIQNYKGLEVFQDSKIFYVYYFTRFDYKQSLQFKLYITFYNSSDGTESQPTETDEYPALFPRTFGMPTITDPQVDYVRVYFLGINNTKPVLVKEIPKGITNFTITIDDVRNGTAVLDSYDNAPAPKGLAYLTESNAMLFGVLGYNLHYSLIGQPNYWSEFNFIGFENLITGIGATQNGLLVFTKQKTYIITGNSPETLSKFLLDGSQGCEGHLTIQHINNTLVWLSNDGLCASSGGGVANLTKTKFDMSKVTGVSACVTDDSVYYLSTNAFTFVADFTQDLKFQTLSNTYKCLYHNKNDDKLYGVNRQNKIVLVNGDEVNLKTLKYKTPKFASGSFSNLKLFKTIFLNSTGNLKFKVILDKGETRETYLKGGVEEIKIPEGLSRSSFVQFEITGIGTLNEIEYKVEDRQNGR